MIEILLALWPVAALIAIGNILRRTGFLVEEFWDDAGRLVFFVLSVVVLARTATGKKGKSSGWLRVPGAVLGHPLIIALAIGWVLNYAGLGAVTPIGQVTAVLGQGALPVALLCVGAGLRLSVLREAELITFVSVALKMVVMPALAFLACLVVRLDGAVAIVAVLFAALPTSATAYMLSRRMGGHHDLVAVIMSVETLVAAVTIPTAVLVANIAFGPMF